MISTNKNFLDLNNTKNNNKLSFGIFHKPLQTNMVIHNSSMHSFSHKLAAFRTYIHRLVNVPMSQENFQVELNIIKQIAINNGSISHLIDKMVEKKLFKQAIALVYPPPANLPPQKYHVLTYIGSI